MAEKILEAIMQKKIWKIRHQKSLQGDRFLLKIMEIKKWKLHKNWSLPLNHYFRRYSTGYKLHFKTGQYSRKICVDVIFYFKVRVFSKMGNLARLLALRTGSRLEQKEWRSPLDILIFCSLWPHIS